MAVAQAGPMIATYYPILLIPIFCLVALRLQRVANKGDIPRLPLVVSHSLTCGITALISLLVNINLTLAFWP